MPGRHFINRLPDYVGSDKVKIPGEKLVQMIKNYLNIIVSKQSKSSRSCDGGLYVGIGGIAFMFLKLAQLPQFSDEKELLLKTGKEYLDLNLQYIQGERGADQAAFLLGAAGIHAVAAVYNAVLGKQEDSAAHAASYASAAKICQPIHFLRCGGDELLVGRAGYLCGALWLTRELSRIKGQLQQPVSAEDINKVCNATITSGLQYAQQHRSNSPLMYSYYDTEYLGAAHGLSGILQMLMSCKNWLSITQGADQHLRATTDFFLSIESPSGNYAPAMDEVGRASRPESEELVHWCHGAPGVVYLYARAYLLWKDEKYLNACKRCGQLTWEKGLLRKGPGICHGVAGSGYVFLLLYRLTHEELWLHRALQFASFLENSEFVERARTPDCPFSLYEGLAGTVCFLSDLLSPDKAEFPFFDVFSY